MTQTSGRLFDELAKMMTNAAGMAQGLRAETETVMRAQAERLLRELDVVQREEFEAVKEMAAKARDQNERLEKRIAELEKSLAKANPAAGARTAPEPKAATRSRPARGSAKKAGKAPS